MLSFSSSLSSSSSSIDNDPHDVGIETDADDTDMLNAADNNDDVDAEQTDDDADDIPDVVRFGWYGGEHALRGNIGLEFEEAR
jgi:hypothetical protein